MPDPTLVNAQVVDVINKSASATMASQVVLTSGAGKAYQSVAQSSAIAVQDAADALRNISTIATTAAGVAMAQFLATGEPRYETALNHAQDMVKSATSDYLRIGTAAASILEHFPSG
jgi:hypothetical protein